MYEPSSMLLYSGAVLPLMMYVKEFRMKDKWLKYPKWFKVFWWTGFVVNGVGFGLYLDYYFW